MPRPTPRSDSNRLALLAALVQPERTNFFTGRLLAEADLKREQEYHESKRRRLRLATMGVGVVAGLNVSHDATGFDVTPGLAVDARGREIIVPSAVRSAWPPDLCDASSPSGLVDLGRGNTLFILVCYAEDFASPVPSTGPTSGPDSPMEPSIVRETFLFSFVAAKSLQDSDSGVIIARINQRRAPKPGPRVRPRSPREKLAKKVGKKIR